LSEAGDRSRGAPRALLVVLAATLLVVGTSCTKVTVLGGLMVVMSTDGTLFPDTLVVDITSPEGKAIYRDATYGIPAEAQLPTSIAIVSNGDPTASVSINVSVWAAGIPLDVRQDRVLQIPTDHVAELDIVFSAHCTPQVGLVNGAALSKCGADETCDPRSGLCISGVVTLESDGGAPGSVSPGGDAGAVEEAVAACVPGITQCLGDAVETCASDGQWGPLAACGGSTPFCHGAGMCGVCRDGSSQCSFNEVQTCADGVWGPAEDCPTDAPACSAGTCGQPPSCQGSTPGTTHCGARAGSCCASPEVTGGTYDRTYTNTGNGPTDEANPASVNEFRLDTYDVTVGRFRAFVGAWNAGWMPAAGSGKHAYLNGGQGLVGSGSPGTYEPGWVASDDAYVTPTDDNLECGGSFSTWTPSAGDGETRPINCVNWWESYAFCIWDGGFLPAEAESDYAAAGGNQQREYPWGETDPGTMNQYAIYGCYYPSGSGPCTGRENIAPVGTATLGAGLWGQLDLTGNVWPWTLDWLAPYVDPCIDCVDLTTAANRTHGGADYHDPTSYLLTSDRHGNPPQYRDTIIGFRCARAP
jgi:formylglycine-generating enzyme required for sulfatase activity